ncbi:MAG: hypothetical protein IJQ88_09550 [Clostridia bacterium]|nr:hypothetical protein [Clostridia bacterium]MBQ6722397.1 hypothetical protein [Clostridia bacterium]
MLKLMKYELRKTWSTKAILLAVTAIVEIAYLIGLYADKEGTMSVSVLLLILLAFGGVMVIGLESILTLHRDMNTRQSYMLFMTPNSCYKILGAKILECGVSILLTGAFFFALGVLDITLLFAKEGQLSRLWETVQQFLSHFSVNGRALDISVRTMSAVAFVLLTAWISLISTAYLADVISAALLNGKKHNGFVSFLLFILLSYVTNRAAGLITASIHDSYTLMMVYGLIDLAFAAVMYVVTAMIMERKLSV